MRLLRFVPNNTAIAFMRLSRVAYLCSSLGLLVSLVLFFTMGLNYGIDFRGGTLVEIKMKTPARIVELRSTLATLGLGEVEIQQFGASDDILVRLVRQPGGDDAQQDAVGRLKQALGPDVTYRRTEVIGPKVSKELARQGTIAVLAAVMAVLIYIWLRFEWQFAIGAVLALVHDITLTIGIFCVFQFQFTLSIIAALLTIVGYSLNDTVVVYDRIRENLRKYKKKPLPELIDLSINETLSRTTLTSFTTVLALLALYIFGGEVIRDFTFAMLWGVVVGTYSSIFVASPLLITLGMMKRSRGQGDLSPQNQTHTSQC